MSTFTMANGSYLCKVHVYQKLCPLDCTNYVRYPVTLNSMELLHNLQQCSHALMYIIQ